MLIFKKCKYIVIRLVLRVLCNEIIRTNNIYEVFSMKVSFNHFKLTIITNLSYRSFLF